MPKRTVKWIFPLVVTLAVIASSLVLAPRAVAAPASCGGTVFHDYDADGQRLEDYSHISPDYAAVEDDGVGGITVTITDAVGVVSTAVTADDGTWNISTLDTADFPIRIDFSDLPTDWTSGEKGPNSAGLTQFVTDPAACGVGAVGSTAVNAPGSFCENRPELATTCFLFGNIDGHDDMAAVVTFIDGAVDNGSTTGSDWQDDKYTVEATLGEVGTVYGLDNFADGTVLTASFVKRHTQLGPTANPTTIYRVGTAGVAPWFTVDSGAVNPHSGQDDGWLRDNAAFDDVGRAGLGDLEISPDGSTAYVVDLGNKELVTIPVNADGTANAGAVTRTAITAAATGAPCGDADLRPFGLGFDDNQLLVGVTCTAESTVDSAALPIDEATVPALGDASQLSAHIYEFSGSFSLLTDVPLPATNRGVQNGQTDPAHSAYAHGQAEWHPWISAPQFAYNFVDWPASGVAYAQPLLSDITVDGGDLIVGFMDIWAHQMGSNAFYTGADGNEYQIHQPLSSGDTVRATANGAGGYNFPMVGADFFYTGDNYGSTHSETTLGSPLQIPGRPYMLTNSFDPINGADTWQSGGVEWFANITTANLDAGDHIRGYRLYDGRADLAVGTFEKAAGIGDVHALCGEAPIEVGDRLWFDTDADGHADPDEPAMAGIVVELLDTAGNVVATTTSDANGLYLFDTDSIDGFDRGSDYTIQVAQVNYDAGGVFAAGGVHEDRGHLTTSNAGSDDANDSDGVLVGGLPQIAFTATANDHTMDFGFVPVPVTLELGNVVFFDDDNNGVQDAGEAVAAGVAMELLDAASNVVDTTRTDASGFYLFSGLEAGTYTVRIPASEFASGGVLEGYHGSTGADVSANPNDNVDLNSDGIVSGPARTNGLVSGPVVLSVGGEPTGEIHLSPTGTPDANSNLTVDFGVYMVALGDLVFLDTNNNGVRDSGEAPIPDVLLALCDEAGNPVLGADGQPMTAVTDASGNYRFEGLTDGNYVVKVVAANFAAGGALEGHTSSTGNDVNGFAPDPDDDVDNDDNGTLVEDVVLADPVTITASDEPDNNRNFTVDFGFTPLAGLGTLVFIDANADGVQDANEPGVPGVVITVVDTATDELVATTVTDANGEYEVVGLLPGTYTVTFTDPEGRVYTLQNIGNTALDSNTNPDGTTGVIVLGPGDFDATIDAGILAAVVPPVTTPPTTAPPETVPPETTPPTAAPPETGEPRLAFTGASSQLMLLLAVLMVASGALLVRIARSREITPG